MGKISNFGAIGDGSIRVMLVKLVKLVKLVILVQQNYYLPDNVWQKFNKISARQCPANYFLQDNVWEKFSAGQCPAKLFSNIGAVGDGSTKGNVGKVGKIRNFGTIGDGSYKGNVPANFFFCRTMSGKSFKKSLLDNV